MPRVVPVVRVPSCALGPLFCLLHMYDRFVYTEGTKKRRPPRTTNTSKLRSGKEGGEAPPKLGSQFSYHTRGLQLS